MVSNMPRINARLHEVSETAPHANAKRRAMRSVLDVRNPSRAMWGCIQRESTLPLIMSANTMDILTRNLIDDP